MNRTQEEIDELLRQSISMQIEDTIRLHSRGEWYPFFMGVLFALCMIAMGVVLSVGLTHFL